MNAKSLTPAVAGTALQRVEFYRLPAPGKRDPYFGLSRGWYYKAFAQGEIKMIALRQRNALRGVRLVVLDSVVAYICRAGQSTPAESKVAPTSAQLPIEFPSA